MKNSDPRGVDMSNAVRIFPTPDYYIMQYTGLKDKNAKEIYEDDIFKAPHDYGPGGFKEQIGRVIFHEALGYQWNYWDFDKLEIIGNFHENPELLENAL